MSKSNRIQLRLKLYAKGFKSFWSRFSRNKPAIVGLAILVILLFVAITADILPLYNPQGIDTDSSLMGPTADHLFGTDLLGRDVFSRVLFGTKISLLVGFFAGVVTIIAGTILGVLAGYVGGRIDDLLMRFTEIVLIIPSFMLAILVVAIFGGKLWIIVMVIGLTHWPGTARIIRSQVLSLKEQEFIESARAIGCNWAQIVFRHLIPNVISSMIVLWSMMTSRAIIIEASLSFLGLGDPNVITWGQMLLGALGYLRSAWWGAVFPGLAIFLTVIAFNMVGEGLTEAFNPRLREI